MVRPRLATRFSALIDLVIVLVFVGIGRSVHDHGVNLAGLVSTAWPFVTGLAAGWLLVTTTKRSGASPIDGALVCATTVALGMVLRVVSGQGTAVAFIAVALGFLGLLMVGWRVLAQNLWRLKRSGAVRSR
jgi:Protein of unknown function (DUF3054)